MVCSLSRSAPSRVQIAGTAGRRMGSCNGNQIARNLTTPQTTAVLNPATGIPVHGGILCPRWPRLRQPGPSDCHPIPEPELLWKERLFAHRLALLV